MNEEMVNTPCSARSAFYTDKLIQVPCNLIEGHDGDHQAYVEVMWKFDVEVS